MDPYKRQQLVERVWILQQLRAEAAARAERATGDARRARDAAADAGRHAADLHEQAASLGGQLADLHDQLGESAEAGEARAVARAEQQEADDERARQRR
jgi:hypothetical protein